MSQIQQYCCFCHWNNSSIAPPRILRKGTLKMKTRLMAIFAAMMVLSISIPASAGIVPTASMQVDRYTAASKTWSTLSGNELHVTLGDTFRVIENCNLTDAVFSPVYWYMHDGAALSIKQSISQLGVYVATRPGSVSFHGLATDSVSDIAMATRVYIDLPSGWTVVILPPKSGQNTGIASGQVGSVTAGSSGYAYLWSKMTAKLVDLTPVGYTASACLGVSDDQQVGFASKAGRSSQACLWNGSANSYVDLSNSEWHDSKANGVCNGQQVGYYTKTDDSGIYFYGCLWNSTAASLIDLTPPGYTGSIAYGTDGHQQVGLAYSPSFGGPCLWNGSATSFVDLTPGGGYIDSKATCVSNGLQAGTASIMLAGYSYNHIHAAMWTGSAESFVDLNPTGYISSEVDAIYDGIEVGKSAKPKVWGESPQPPHASMWTGTAESFLDLHDLLPAGYTSSTASGIYKNSNSIYIIGSAGTASSSNMVMWIYTK